ncbi:hypothetical protein EHS25_002427 [Saitozyma podzolica]|uniref:Uncharacterized protein n=1 Tax=Saitozyma podzolica TaxID=1890683 RepID=A0A427YDT8_9TREE|nr:hypothetical protein EHS25_002427 [Saitozyma podzolica]
MATGHSKAGFQSVLARDDTSAEAKQHAKECVSAPQLGMSDKGHSRKSSSGDDIDVDDDDQLAGGENISPTRTVISYPIPKQAKEHSRQVLEENDADY